MKQNKIGLSGHYSLIVRKADGSVKRQLDFDNLILNSGLNAFGIGGIAGHAELGAGTTSPNVSETGLVTPLVVSSSLQALTQGHQTTTPYYAWARITYRFGVGVAVGNFSEVGIGPGTSSGGGDMFSRALIVDSGGTPTTVTVLADESIDVVYELRIYPPLNDIVGDVLIGGVTYSVTARPAFVGTGLWDLNAIFQNGMNSQWFVSLFDGGVGPINAGPTGDSSFSFSSVAGNLEAYVPGTYQRFLKFDWPLNMVVPGGIGAVQIRQAPGNFTFGQWQFGFIPKLNKLGTQELSLRFKLSWARHA